MEKVNELNIAYSFWYFRTVYFSRESKDINKSMQNNEYVWLHICVYTQQ